MTFAEFLRYLQGPAVGTVVGAILSVVAEYWPWYQALASKVKRLVFAGMCFVVPLVGAALACAMGYQPCGWEETFWPAIYQGGLVAFGVGTAVIHNLLYAGE